MTSASKNTELFTFTVDKIKFNANLSREDISSVEFKLKVMFSENDYSMMYDSRLQHARKVADIKGFRPGKAPISIIEQRYSENLKFETMEKLLDNFLKSYLKDIKIASTPKVEFIDNDPTKFSFDLTVELIPEIKLPNWNDITIENPIYAIEDTKITNVINDLKAKTRQYQKAEDDYKAQNNDQVELDFEGFVDGVAFAGGKAENHKLVLGSNVFIPGFEEQLLGVKAGDHITVNVKFPADYGSKDLANKDAEFKVFVHAVETAAEVEINDEWTMSNFAIESVEKLKELATQQLSSGFDKAIFQFQKEKLLDKLDKEITINLPKSLYEEECKSVLANLKHSHHHHENHDHSCDENMEQESKDLANRRLKLGFIIAKYQEEFKINLQDQEFEKYIAEQYVQMGESGEYFIKYIRNNPDKANHIRANLLEDKIIKDILAKVKLEDKNYSTDEIGKLSA